MEMMVKQPQKQPVAPLHISFNGIAEKKQTRQLNLTPAFTRSRLQMQRDVSPPAKSLFQKIFSLSRFQSIKNQSFIVQVQQKQILKLKSVGVNPLLSITGTMKSAMPHYRMLDLVCIL